MRLLLIALVLDKVLYVFDHFLWLSKDKKNKVKINTKREILMVSKIWCSNLILSMDIFSEFFLLSYKTLSKTKAMNNNLIEYISKTEEFYIGELESLNTYRKTKPKDLIYLEKTSEKKESLFKKNLKSFIEGFDDSKYQMGYWWKNTKKLFVLYPLIKEDLNFSIFLAYY